MSRPDTTKKLTKKKSFITEDGTPAGTGVIDLYVNLLKRHILAHGHKINHPRLITQFMGFTVKGRTKFDMVVAAGYAEIAEDAPFKPKIKGVDFTGLYKSFN